MPDFASARNSKSFDKKLSKEELIRAIRFSISAECEAIQIYEQIAESTDNKKAKAVLEDIIREEKVHAGQFLGVLYDLAPSELAEIEKGQKENQDLK